MLSFVLIGYDKAGALPTRMAHRGQHLETLTAMERAGRLHHAGPILSDKGEPCGSVVVFSAESMEAARAVVAADPYVINDVFERTELYETKRAFPSQPA